MTVTADETAPAPETPPAPPAADDLVVPPMPMGSEADVELSVPGGDPFPPEQQTQTFDVSKPISFNQLIAEISEALGNPAGLQVRGYAPPEVDSPDAPPAQATSATMFDRVTGEAPGKLFITAADPVDESKIDAVLVAHSPDPLWGTSPEVQAAATTVTESRPVLDKLSAGEDLSASETQQALRALLAMQTAAAPAPPPPSDPSANVDFAPLRTAVSGLEGIA